MTSPRILAGRFWAYVGTVGGVAVSATANYTETVTNNDVPASAAVGAALLMALLPIGLFVALEVLVRNRIKEHLWWWRGGMLITALAFAIPSYIHMHDLLSDWGQAWLICIVTPFGWDGLMLLSTLALLLDPNRAANADETVLAPASRYEYIVQIPAAPAITRTITLEPKSPEVPREPKPPKKAATRRKPSNGVRFNRPEDHPLFAQWQREDWSDEEFAARSGKSLGAARAQAGRWRKHLSTRPGVNGNQMELIKT